VHANTKKHNKIREKKTDLNNKSDLPLKDYDSVFKRQCLKTGCSQLLIYMGWQLHQC